MTGSHLNGTIVKILVVGSLQISNPIDSRDIVDRIFIAGEARHPLLQIGVESRIDCSECS